CAESFKIYSLSLHDALPIFSSKRALTVSKSLIQRGVNPNRITTLFYGDSRPLQKVHSTIVDGRVEFMIKKNDLRTEGRKVEAKRSEEHTSELQSRENLVCRL